MNLNLWQYKKSTYSYIPFVALVFIEIFYKKFKFELAAIEHNCLVIICQARNKEWNILKSRARTSIPWAVVWSEVTRVFMHELGVVRDDLRASKLLILAMQFKRFSHILQSQTPYITELLPTSGTFVEYPCFTASTECVSIVALPEQKLCFKHRRKTCIKFGELSKRQWFHCLLFIIKYCS